MNSFLKLWPWLATLLVILASTISGATPFYILLSLVGILFVLGVAYKRPESQLLGAGFVGMLAYASFQAGFLANAIVNGIVLVPLSIFGYFYWKKRGKGLERTLEPWQLWTLIVLTVFVTGGIYFGYTLGAGGALPLMDALTGVLPVVATVLMVFAYKEQWYVWVPYNIIQALMWFSAASVAPTMLAVFVLKVVFLINSLIGYHQWRQQSD